MTGPQDATTQFRCTKCTNSFYGSLDMAGTSVCAGCAVVSATPTPVAGATLSSTGVAWTSTPGITGSVGVSGTFPGHYAFITTSDNPVGFVKNDSGKSRVDLIPASVLEELGHVLRIGAEKYSATNWAKGAAWSRYIGAALRHVYAFSRGEDKDAESGFSHLAHAMACLCFLFEYARCGLGTDDRWKGQ